MKNIITTLTLLLLVPIVASSQTETMVYDEIAPFSEGLAAVRIGDQWGFLLKMPNKSLISGMIWSGIKMPIQVFQGFWVSVIRNSRTDDV